MKLHNSLHATIEDLIEVFNSEAKNVIEIMEVVQVLSHQVFQLPKALVAKNEVNSDQ